VIVTTGRFTADAENEAKKPWQNNRHVYLIDGETLVDICKLHGIGVKKAKLTELLVLDPELTREPGSDDAEEDSEAADMPRGEEAPSSRRLRDEMLGDLSVDELAELSGFASKRPRLCSSCSVADQSRSPCCSVRAPDSCRWLWRGESASRWRFTSRATFPART